MSGSHGSEADVYVGMKRHVSLMKNCPTQRLLGQCHEAALVKSVI